MPDDPMGVTHFGHPPNVTKGYLLDKGASGSRGAPRSGRPTR